VISFSGEQELVLAEKIAPDSKVSDIIHTLSNPVEYVRQIIGNFVSDQYNRATDVVRIGVAGIGVAPNYKIESPFTLDMLGTPRVMWGARIYHGRNHKEIEAFTNNDTRDEHWSTQTMTYDELAALIGELRSKRKNI
jgi:hypothetical protein